MTDRADDDNSSDSSSDSSVRRVRRSRTQWENRKSVIPRKRSLNSTASQAQSDKKLSHIAPLLAQVDAKTLEFLESTVTNNVDSSDRKQAASSKDSSTDNSAEEHDKLGAFTVPDVRISVADCDSPVDNRQSSQNRTADEGSCFPASQVRIEVDNNSGSQTPSSELLESSPSASNRGVRSSHRFSLPPIKLTKLLSGFMTRDAHDEPAATHLNPKAVPSDLLNASNNMLRAHPSLLRALLGSTMSVQAPNDVVIDKECDPETHDGWSGSPYEKGGVTTRIKGRRTVFLMRASDVLLFDKIAAYKAKNPHTKKEDVWDEFVSRMSTTRVNHQQVDAIVKLIYTVKRYDYILKFRVSSDTRYEDNRTNFERKLLRKGLIVERECSIEDPREYYVKIVSPFYVLCNEAQLNKLKIQLKDDDTLRQHGHTIKVSSWSLFEKHAILAKIYGILKPLFDDGSNAPEFQSAVFNRNKMHLFKGGDINERSARHIQSDFFRDGQRSLLTYQIINSAEIKVKGFGKSRKEGIQYLLAEGIYSAMFHLHDDDIDEPNKPLKLRSILRKEWAQKYFAFQPLDDISAYFGEKVALYFVFAGYYNMWLIIACAFGLLVCLYGISEATRFVMQWLLRERLTEIDSGGVFNWTKIFDNKLTPWFGLVMSLWAMLMPAVWKRRANYMTWRWSTMDFERDETKRPKFRTNLTRRSQITGKQELYFPQSKRLGRQIVSALVVLLWVVVISISIAIQVSIGAYVSPYSDPIAVSVFTSVLGLISIVVMKIPFSSVVNYLNEWENYRTESQFEDALILKSYVFDFTNSYAQLIYYAFVKPNLSSKRLFNLAFLEDSCNISVPEFSEDQTTCASGVMINLLVIFIGGQLIERFQEICIPWFVAKVAALRSKIKLRWRRFMIQRKRVKLQAASVTPEARADPAARHSGNPFSYTQSVGIIDEEYCAQERVPHATEDFRAGATTLPGHSHSESEAKSRAIDSDRTNDDSSTKMLSVQSANGNYPSRPVLYSISRWKDEDYVMQEATEEAVRLPQYYRDDKLNPFGGVREEYAQKVIQFGFLAMFVCIFPLAPCFALFNNVYEIRADAYKLLVVYQRSIPARAQDIGFWENIIFFVSRMGVVMNAFIIAFTSPAFYTMFLVGLSEGWVLAVRLGFLLAFHYVVYLIASIITLAVPQMANSVSTAMQRAAYLERIQRDEELEDEDETLSVNSLIS